MDIRVGIPTDGEPNLESGDGVTVLHNMLIGVGFHWQRALQVRLPGKVTLTGQHDFPVLNTLPLETYLECVVGSEMNPNAPAEFLKAHAVVSRTWAAGKVMRAHPSGNKGMVHASDRISEWADTGDHEGFDVCSDDHCQRYQGLQPVSPEALGALRATAGMVLCDLCGSLVDARFSKCCGGRTELFSTCWQDVEMPCLESFADPWCDLRSLPHTQRRAVLSTLLKDYDLDTPALEWTVSVTGSEVGERMAVQHGVRIGAVTAMEAVERGPSGRIKSLRLTGSGGSVTIGKELAVRRLLSPTCLYSSAFDIETRYDRAVPGDTVFVLRGRGWGHGVGMCQTGAAVMATQDRSCTDILAFYYPGSRLASLQSLLRP